MIFWIILFALIVLISFLLALRSMADFAENPTEKKQEYGLYLIRSSRALNKDVLDTIHGLILKENLIISFERLIRGGESALVVFGPQEILHSFSEALNLLELEDYAGVDPVGLQAWEMGVRKQEKINQTGSFFKGLPPLPENEQLWWQLVLKGENLKGDKLFEGQIRVVTSSTMPQLKNPAAGDLIKIPKPFTKEQIFDFYKKRTFINNKFNPILESKAVLEILALD